MRLPALRFVSGFLMSVTILISPSLCLAQRVTNPDSLSRNPFGWNQEEQEFGFAHFDQIFPARDVPHGRRVRDLPKGMGIPAFAPGGQKEKDLEAFITNQKVAGLLILQNGKVRLERYTLGFSEADRWTSQSVAKSVTSTLVGAAIKDGYIKSINDPVTQYLPGLKGSAYDSVTIRQLLTMTSGVRWNENYADPNSDIVRFYTSPVDSGMDEAVSYMRKLPRVAGPGKKWVYSTGETHLLGSLVSAATKQNLSGYLSSKIWAPYGMEAKATWTTGRTKEELAGCCLQMKLRDFGRFGQFILEGARIKGKSILPDDWLQTATHTQIPLWPGWGYGYLWWTLNDGTFRALGIHGQMIYIDPARHLVVVVNSVWPEAESFARQTAVENFLRILGGEIDKENKIR